MVKYIFTDILQLTHELLLISYATGYIFRGEGK